MNLIQQEQAERAEKTADWSLLTDHFSRTSTAESYLLFKTMKTKTILVVLVSAVAFTTTIARAADPLPSWNDGPAKQSVLNFVTKVTSPGSPDFVPVPERIAVYDNDGTLWSAADPTEKHAAFARSLGAATCRIVVGGACAYARRSGPFDGAAVGIRSWRGGIHRGQSRGASGLVSRRCLATV